MCNVIRPLFNDEEKKCSMIFLMISSAFVTPATTIFLIISSTSLAAILIFSAKACTSSHIFLDKTSVHLKLVASSMSFSLRCLMISLASVIFFATNSRMILSISETLIFSLAAISLILVQTCGERTSSHLIKLTSSPSSCGKKVFLYFLNDLLCFGNSLGNDVFDNFHNFLIVYLEFGCDFFDFGTDTFRESIGTFEVRCHVDNFSSDVMDDVFCLSQFFIKSFSNKFVDFYSFDFKFFRGLSQVMANFVRQNFFAGDLVDELSREEVFLDLLDDLLDLDNSFSNNIFDDLLDFCH